MVTGAKREIFFDMQIKIFSIPIIGGESENDALNVFLRSHKILQVKQQLVEQPDIAYWCFSIKYLEDYKLKGTKRGEIDYKSQLEPKAFDKFQEFRKIRKKVAETEGVPAFVIFTDKELSELSKQETLSKNDSITWAIMLVLFPSKKHKK
ncbi:MAG: superfamily II DNA helicase RecQ [Saprospiraceae bacterium]